MSGILESGDWVAYAILVIGKATVLLACAYVASWLLRRRPAAVRHAVWAAAVAGVVALPLLGAAFPSLRVAVPLPAFIDAVAAPVVASGAHGPEGPTWPNGQIGSDAAVPVSAGVAGAAGDASSGVAAGAMPTAWSEVSSEAGSARPVVSDRAAASRSGWPLPVSGGALLLLVWLAGALAVLAWTLLSMVHVWLLARRARELRDMRVLARAHGIASELGVTWPVEVLEGDADAMPMTFGVLSDTLLLPSTARSWSAARLEGVLRHELAHIRRRDSLTQLIADIGCALYWFHPGVWLAAQRIREEREHACDDVVLLAGARATDYAGELLDLARTMRARPAVARAALAMAQTSRLRARLVAVLEDRPRAARLPGTLLAPLGGAALALVMMLAAVTPSVASQAADRDAPVAGDTIPAPPPAPPAPPVGPPPPFGLEPPVAPSPPFGLLPLPAPPPPFGVQPLPAPPPPFGLEPPPAPAPVPPAGAGDPACWGRFTADGAMIERDAGTHRVRTIQKTLGDLVLCMRTSGEVELDATGAAIRSMGPGAVVVLESREPGRALRLEITRGASGLEHAWWVDGERRPFDRDAAEWRDAMLELLHSAGASASVRGRVASLRGEVASVMARISSIESARRITTDLATRSRLEQEIERVRASIGDVERRMAGYDGPGRVSALEERLREQAAALEAASRDIEARAASLNTASLVADVEARLAALDMEREVARIQAGIEALAALDVEGEVARIQELIEALDADGLIAGIQARMASQERRLRESLRRIQ